MLVTLFRGMVKGCLSLRMEINTLAIIKMGKLKILNYLNFVYLRKKDKEFIHINPEPSLLALINKIKLLSYVIN